MPRTTSPARRATNHRTRIRPSTCSATKIAVRRAHPVRGTWVAGHERRTSPPSSSSRLCSVTEFFILHTSALEVFPRLPRTPFSSSASSVGYDGYVDVLGSLRPGTVLPYLSSSRIFHPSLAGRTWSSTASRSIPTNVWGLKPRTTTSFARSSAVPSTSTGLQCL